MIKMAMTKINFFIGSFLVYLKIKKGKVWFVFPYNFVRAI